MKPCNAIALALSCIFLSLQSRAQLTVFGGAQMTSADYSIRNAGQKSAYKLGYAGGVGLKSLVEGPVYFSPLLYYSRKGYDVTFDRPAAPPDSGAVNNHTALHTIELAPLIQINLSKKENYVFLRLGPSFDLNLSGKEDFDSTNNKHVSRNMKFSFADYSYATIQLNAHIGFQHSKGFTAFAYYSHGMSSLNNADYGPTIFHRVFGLAVGWKFGKKP